MMRTNKRTLTTAVFMAVVLLGAAGCKKKVAPPPPPPPAAKEVPPPPPPPPPPAIRIDAFQVEPSTITQGQTATLRWATANGTEITIQPGIGAVVASGTRSIQPQNSTTYTITLNGPGGQTRSQTATVTVNLPPRPVETKPVPQAPKIDGMTLLTQEGRDAYFDYDSSDIRGDARTALQQNADLLKRIFAADPTFRVVMEGHCDERGSAEYNLGLGDRRSTSAKDYLVQLGVPADRISTISYGKDRPQCTDATEDCYQKNRRAHLAPAR